MASGLRFAKKFPVTLDASGAGTALFDCGGYDVVIDGITVSTLTNVKESTAKIYLDTTNPVGFLGGSSTGSYDQSSSTVGLSAGRTLMCAWAGGDAGTVATLALTGTQYAPGEGPRISGGTVTFQRTIVGAAQFGEKIAAADSLVSTALPGAATITGPIIDMRQWASFYLSLLGTRNGVATNYNPISVRLLWFADAAGTQLVYADAYEILAFRSVAPFDTLGGRLNGQDILHGPWMQVMITNSGPDPCDVSYQLSGTTRGLPGPYYQETAQTLPPNIYNPDAFIISPAGGSFAGLGAGLSVTFPGLMRYGRARWRISTNQNFTATFTAGSMTPEFYSTTGTGAAPLDGELIIPKRSLLLRVTNNGAANMTTFLNVISQSDKF